MIGPRQFETHGTPMVAVRVDEAEALFRLREARTRQMRVRGLVSVRARQELGDAGWTVLDIEPWRQPVGERSH